MSTSSKKRKLEEVQESSSSSELTCIIHRSDSNNQRLTVCSADSFNKLQSIRSRRLAEPLDSVRRMTDICMQFPTEYSERFAYHRDCYQRFTSNLHRLSDSAESVASSEGGRRSRSLQSEKIIFKPDCIFCGSEGRKGVKVKGAWTTEPTVKFDRGGGVSIQDFAESIGDEKLLTRIRGFDLFACEAQYHRSCQKKYLQNPEKWRSQDEDQKIQQSEKEAVHREALNAVQEVIDSQVIHLKKVLKLSQLRDLYVRKLEKTEFANPNYRGENLKTNLEKKYGTKLKFIKMDSKGKFTSYLVVDSETDIESAVKFAFELGNADTITDTALAIRKDVLDAFEDDEEFSWPPTVHSITSQSKSLPPNLSKFLSILFSGKKSTGITPKEERLISSIGQDICRAVTNGRWKLPKHILLCMALRHWFRSAELTTLLNRLGHSETYSYSLELETGIALAVETTSNLLSPQIVRNPNVPFIFHSDFDNYDQLLNDLCGVASVHTSHGIMLQDFSCPADVDIDGDMPVIPAIDKTGIRSLKLDTQQVLPDCYVTHRKSPSFKVEKFEVPGSKERYDNANRDDMLWIMARYLSSYLEQELPGFGGMVSILGDPPERLTTIDYYPVINTPITDNKAVQECLRYSEDGAKEVGQEYVVTTFDLGVCMKAFPIIWNQPKRYEKHIVMIGTFHVVCAYLKMVGKKMEGSGFSDILLEAGLIGSGSLTGVMSGKHYSRAMHCHKVMLEALERLLFKEFCYRKGEIKPMMTLSDDAFELLKSCVDEPGTESFRTALRDPDIASYVDGYIQFRKETKEGLLGKTAQFWVAYMDHVWLVLELTKAVKTNDYVLYSRCLFLMCDLFFSFGGQNYARYLTFFSVFLANLETSHPGATDLLKRGAISVARSFIPGNRCPVDKTIEETFMKHSKSHGGAGGGSAGLSGLLRNYDSYQRWIRAAHERAQFVKATLGMADMLTDTSDGKHRDLRSAEIRRGEEQVVTVAEAINGFVNPFDTDDKDKVYCISSGAPARSDIQNDILRAEESGEKAKSEFIQDRLEKRENFFEPIKRLNLKTFSDMSKKSTIKSTQNKIIEYKQQSNIAFQLLVRSQCEDLKLDLKELLKYPLTPVPYSLATPDGFLNKTDKSKGYHFLVDNIEDAVAPADNKTLVIEDGNAVFYYLKELPQTFGDICRKIFDIVVRKSDVIFSTDMYIEQSVKSMERLRRGCGDKLLVRGENTKKPPDWKMFLSNEENKEQLIQMLCRVWGGDSYAHKLINKKLIAICEGHAHLLTTENGEEVSRQEIDSLLSTQEETDSRIVLYCMYGAQQGYEFVRIRSPDTDVFFILLYYALQIKEITILFDTGVGNKKRLINITRLARTYRQEYCSALLALHAFTRCDSTSAFKGIGKVKPIKTLQKMPRFVQSFSEMGESWRVPEDMFLQMEAFTCAMYGSKQAVTVNEVRYSKIREKCCSTGETFDSSRNIDISSLPPCRDCLREHIKRVNYQIGIWKRSHIAKPDYPPPTDDHGWHVVDGVMEPKWVSGQFMPQQLVDVLINEDVLEEDSDEDDGEFDDVLYALNENDSGEEDEDYA